MVVVLVLMKMDEDMFVMVVEEVIEMVVVKVEGVITGLVEEMGNVGMEMVAAVVVAMVGEDMVVVVVMGVVEEEMGAVGMVVVNGWCLRMGLERIRRW